MKKIALLCHLLILCQGVIAQSQQGQLIRIMVSPAKSDMLYAINEDITFDIAVYKFGQLVPNAAITYSCGPEMMEPQQADSITLVKGNTSLKVGSIQQPGFYRCHVTYTENGIRYHNSGTAGISPEQIKPTAELPEDFADFWRANLNAAAEVPLEPVLTLMPEKSTFHSDVYHVAFRNISGHIYGILTKPKKPGKYPAILVVPGAGIRPYNARNLDLDVITLQIGIHGIPVNLYDSPLYQNLAAGALASYNTINLDDKDRYYYKRVYVGCVRAVDFIHSLEDFDGKQLGVMGGSQGGALSIVTAALDNRVKYLVSYYPALADLPGYLHGRAGGWPHLFKNSFTNQPAKIETAAYYDVVNFARQLQVPGLYSFGFNDNVCPPTSIYAAINVIPAEKDVSLYKDAAHWTYPEQFNEGDRWMFKKLGVRYQQ
ncbi:MAG: acetylxylan esterase [Alphaproteobacteria bacterium]|nr:acetylxylan esterase [Alphaproteobacteria bacterium]